MKNDNVLKSRPTRLIEKENADRLSSRLDWRLIFLMLASTSWVQAADDVVELEEITVSGEAITETLSAQTLDAAGLEDEKSRVTDTAGLFKDIPGVSLNTGGGVSSLPAVHGLADDRVKIVVDGMNITSACSNHMNPALSYMAPSAVGKATVMAGITPVSEGGDSVGGTIAVEPLAPEFASADQDYIKSLKVGSFFRSVNDNVGSTANASYATQRWRMDFDGSWSKARSYFTGDDGAEVVPSAYQNWNQSVKLSTLQDSGLWSFKLSGQHMPYQGFPNQRMDLVRNDAILAGINYDKDFSWGKVDGKVYYHETRHTMDVLPERESAPMPMESEGSDAGYRLRAHVYLDDRNTLHVGNEFFRQTLHDWWPSANVNPQDYLSINHGERNRIGTFLEWQTFWNPEWTTMLGLRNDTLWMSAGDVQGYTKGYFNRFWSEPFNAADRDRTDVNFDVTALTSYTPHSWDRYELGFARKMRAPNLYERYAWNGGSQKSMITWFGDGNGYQGNLDLESETAYNFSFSANWHDSEQKIWSATVSPYYTHIVDYIWGRTDSIGSDGFRGMYFVNLPYADLFGVDASGRYLVIPESSAGNFAVKASLAYVRGIGQDGGKGRPCPYAKQGLDFVCDAEGWSIDGLQAPERVNLYHMMPLHGTIAMEHGLDTEWGKFSNYLGVELVQRKTTVATTYNEPVTPGYALLNVRTGYEYKQFKMDVGVDNLLDKQYYHPLGGVYMAATRPGTYSPNNLPAVPAMGRSVFVSMNLEF